MTSAQYVADPTDVVGRRIGAFVIDILLMGAVIMALLVPMFTSASEKVSSDTYRCANVGSGNETDFGETINDNRTPIISSMCIEAGDDIYYFADDSEANSFTAKAYGIGIGIQALNLVVLQGLVGASVGKLLLGLRVVRKDGNKAGIGWVFLRWVLLFVDSFCCFLPGAILVFTTKGHRRLGDMAAGTFVVRKDHVGRPLSIPGVTSGYGTPSYPAQGYGQPVPGAWPAGPPAGPPTGPAPSWGGQPTGAAPTSAPPAGDGPTWDAARNAYIQYDREQGAWVQWSDGAQAWLPIDQ